VCSALLPLGDNPIAVNKYIVYHHKNEMFVSDSQKWKSVDI